MTIRRTIVMACTALVTSAACSNDGVSSKQPNVNAKDVVFLTQSEPQVAHMDALFTGRVIIDDVGCTRLADADGATVIWPRGFAVAGVGAALGVYDGEQQRLGLLGGSFRIGGGQVQQLDPALHISYMDRALAQEFCPGSYWIAADVHPVR